MKRLWGLASTAMTSASSVTTGTSGEAEEMFPLAPSGKDFDIYTVADLRQVK